MLVRANKRTDSDENETPSSGLIGTVFGVPGVSDLINDKLRNVFSKRVGTGSGHHEYSILREPKVKRRSFSFLLRSLMDRNKEEDSTYHIIKTNYRFYTYLMIVFRNVCVCKNVCPRLSENGDEGQF